MPRFFDPILQMAELDLEFAQFLLVSFAFYLFRGIAADRPFHCHDVIHFMQDVLQTARTSYVSGPALESARASR
jgi:hypothetical protein